MNSDRTLALSVLDLVPVRTGQTSAQDGQRRSAALQRQVETILRVRVDGTVRRAILVETMVVVVQPQFRLRRRLARVSRPRRRRLRSARVSCPSLRSARVS